MWKKGKSRRVKGDSKLFLFSLKHGTPEKWSCHVKRLTALEVSHVQEQKGELEFG